MDASISQTRYFHSDGYRLAANVHLPQCANGEQVPGVVLCHGFGGIRTHVLPDIATALCEAGYAVLRFDYRGFGESEGQAGRVIPQEQVIDVRNGITYLGARPEVDASRIGLYGSSFGGANAISAAALDERARCVVSTVGVGNGHDWLKSLRRYSEWCDFLEELSADRAARVVDGAGAWVGPDHVAVPDPKTVAWHDEVHERFPERVYKLPLESAERIIEYRPEDVVGRISPRPVLIIHVTDDRLVPAEQAYRLYERAGDPKKLVMLDGLSHQQVYAEEGFGLVMSHSIAWLDAALK